MSQKNESGEYRDLEPLRRALRRAPRERWEAILQAQREIERVFRETHESGRPARELACELHQEGV